MWRRICALIFLVILALSISVQATEPRISAQPSLSFNGTTAFCSVFCRGNSSNDTVDATLTLYQGSTYVGSAPQRQQNKQQNHEAKQSESGPQG